MLDTQFYPEGHRLNTPENTAAISSPAALSEAQRTGRILEARALMCDSAHDLIVDLGGMRGVIPREEGALGIREGTVRDIAILSRVNRPVSFVVRDFIRDGQGRITALLSRRAAQELCQREYIEKLLPGDVIPARVTHLEPFGVFADIGCGISALLPIDGISVSRIGHPRERFLPGMDIRAVVRSRENGRINLTHKELLGTWEENAARFNYGETVPGIIRSVEDYGIFVELAPNLAGLAEPKEGAAVGQHAGVYIKALIPEKMKVKLIIVDVFTESRVYRPPEYFITEGHISYWRYSSELSNKLIESRFSAAGD